MPRLSGLRRIYGLGDDTQPKRPFHRLVQAIYLVALLAGLGYGYSFGERVGGVLLGVVMAINGGLFASILVGAVVDRTLQRKPPPGP